MLSSLFDLSRIFLILPEIGFNVMGTIWAFSDVIKCVNEDDNFANTSIEGKCVEKTPNFDLRSLTLR